MKSDLQRVLLFSALTQLAGFAKGLLIAFFFGVGAELDGYYLAQVIPVALAAVLQVAIQSGLMPVYVRLIAESPVEARRVAWQVLAGLALVCAAASAVLSLSAAWLVAMVAPGASGATVDAAVTALRVLAFLLLFNVVADAFATLLNAHMKFAAAALAPAANAIASGAVLLVVPSPGLDALVWGSLLGVAVQVAIVAWALRSARIGLSFDSKPAPELRTVWHTSLAILPGAVFANVAGAIPQIWAAQLGSGALSVYAYANRLHGMAAQILAVGVSTVLLPHFARLLVERRHADIDAQLRQGLPVVASLGVAIAAWVSLAGEPALRLLFERGKFDARATEDVAAVWFWLSIGLLPMVWGTVLAKVLQAAARTSLLSAFAGLGLLVLLAACQLLAARFGTSGVALAVGVMYLATALLCHGAVARTLGTGGAQRTRGSGLRLFAGAVAAAALLHTALGLLPALHDAAVLLVTSLVLAGVAIAVLLVGVRGGHA